MARDVQFLPATLEHARVMAPLLRKADVEELHAIGFEDALFALEEGLRVSVLAFTILVDGEPAAMFGLQPLKPPLTALGPYEEACCWFLTARGIERRPRVLLQFGRVAVEAMAGLTHRMGNWIDTRYTGAVRFAQWVGFVLGPPVVMPSGVPFRFASYRGRRG